jgi:hypothetical protein
MRDTVTAGIHPSVDTPLHHAPNEPARVIDPPRAAEEHRRGMAVIEPR